jgi:hypothetical protein
MQSQELRKSVMWILLAGFIGFLVPAVFSSTLGWERPIYLIPYTIIVGTFTSAYFRLNPLSAKQLVGPWQKGLIAVVIVGLFLLRNVMGQPPSRVPEGIQLIGALSWMGIIYGALDGFFLNVIPVLVVQKAWSLDERSSRSVHLFRGFVALVASLFVTAAYHLGYTEYQNFSLLDVLLGNAIMTSAYLLTGSPLAAVATHVIMHIGAVLHGMETTLQLPPHYLH